MRKDLGLAREAAEQLDLALPLLDDVTHLWQQRHAAITDDADFNRIVTPLLQAAARKEPTP